MENDKSTSVEATTPLAQQTTWNPELVVSGIAIYATFYLPTGIDYVFNWLLSEWTHPDEFLGVVIPNLVYASLMTGAYLLMAGFSTHLVLRAVWVSLIGLSAVFPQDIQYDKLMIKDLPRREATQEIFGRLSTAVVRLNGLCSMILSVTLAFAMLILNIAFLYAFFLVPVFIVSTFLPGQIAATNSIFWIFFGILLVPSLLNMYLQYFLKGADELKRKFYRFYIVFSLFLFPIGYKTVMRVFYVFKSNTSTQKFTLIIILFSAVVYSVLIVMIFSATISRQGNVLVWPNRDYFTKTHRATYFFDTRLYDNLRAEGKSINEVSLHKDVIEDDFARVFVVYQKSMDEELKKHCQPKDTAAQASRNTKRAFQAAQHLQCWKQFMKVYIGDSLYTSVDWQFTIHPKTHEKGLLAYIYIGHLKQGKYDLKIFTPIDKSKLTPEDDPSRPRYEIPFWVSKQSK